MPKCNGGLPSAVSDSRVSAPNLAPPETGHSLYRATKPPARVCFEHGGIHVCLLRRGVFTHLSSGCYLQRRKKEGATETWFQYRKGPPSSWCCSQYPCCFRANRFPVCVCIGCVKGCGTPFFPVGYIDALSSRKNADKICERRSSLSSPQSLQLALRFLAFDNIPARSSSDRCRHLRMSKGYQKVGFNRQLPEYRTP
jgi:hypothetical protein